MKFYSPLRYPGGKNKLAKFISKICELNSVQGHYIEPYAGGAAVALYLVLEGKVSKVTINDEDRSIYAFWYSILNNTEEFCNLIRKTRISIQNWKLQRDVQKNKETASLLELGFSTFFLNRTNVSGIINAGPIGNIEQTGDYKLNCRFNKAELISRIQKIATFKDKINIEKLDALELIEKIRLQSDNSSTIFYFDPPYYLKAESLYLDHYQNSDHEEVGAAIRNVTNVHWIVSYDNVLPIKRIYKGLKKIEYNLRHSAYESRMGKEILFFSPGLKVPRISDPTKVTS